MNNNIVNDSFRTTSGKTMDWRDTPWPNIATFLRDVKDEHRLVGMPISVKIDAAYALYWFVGGTADHQFLPFDPRINQDDALLIRGVTILEPESKAALSGTRWRLSDIVFTLPLDIEYAIPALVDTGLFRADIIYGDSTGQTTYLVGDEGGTAIAKDLPYGTILITTIYLSAAGIVEQPEPVNEPDIRYRSGFNAPTQALGSPGDYYLDRVLGEVWGKDLMVNGVATWELKYDPSELANSIKFQRKLRLIPRILVNTSGPGKCREFLRIVGANNYVHGRVSVVNFNSTVKNFEFVTGYDALSEGQWSQLVPENVYNDRGEDFSLEIKKVPGFGPVNFGILMRYRNTNASGGSQASIKVEFALELPAVGTNYETFQVINTSPEYDFSGSTFLYGRKLTFTSDGKNWIDTDGLKFLKEGQGGTGGTPGADGDSAYQVALNNGFAGTEAEWLLSLKGDQGDPGPAGTDRFGLEDTEANGLDRTFNAEGQTFEVLNAIKAKLAASSPSGIGSIEVNSNGGNINAYILAYDVANALATEINFKPSGVEITAPQGSFYLPLSVNGEVADPDGNITLPALPGPAPNFAYNETPTGALNGSNATFTSLSNFVAGTVEVFLNGLKLKIVEEFNTTGNNTITLAVSPASTETLQITYLKL